MSQDIQRHKSPPFFKHWIDFLMNCDLFAHEGQLRYKNDDSYATLTGAFVSIALIIMFTVIFAGYIMNTF
jgi:hypothetical protein